MKIFKSVILFLFLIIASVFPVAKAYADTIITDDGKEIKGIVVEEYKDRVVFSTPDGEITVLKPDMRELTFDSEEDNLVALAQQATDRRDYSRAMGYYERALKINPDCRAAKQGVVYLRGDLFRKEESAKAADVKRQQDIEQYGDQMPLRTESDSVNTMSEALEKSVGIRIAISGSVPMVDTIRPGSPAYEAGLRKGDMLVSVWGKLTGYLSLTEILDLLINKSAIETRCVLERTNDVVLSPGKTPLSSVEDLIGASLSMEFDGLTISSVKDAGPAIDSGLQKDDLITSIDGNKTRYMPLKKAIELIKKTSAASVKLTIRRKAIIWRRD